MRLLVELGDSFSADKLIDIKSSHTVLNFGLSFVKAAGEILNQIADAELKVKVRTTADPIIDMTHANEMESIFGLFSIHDQLMRDLKRIGVYGFTCTPYFLDNKPNFGDHCAWSESSAVIYLNSVIGARSNREGGVLDVASAITGKTPNYGLHLKENRKGNILFKINFDDWNLFDLTSIGLKIGEIAGNRIPVIDGLKNISFDYLKNLGAASAATGAVALIHVIGVTPEAENLDIAFQKDKPEEIVELDKDSIEDVKKKYSTEWDDLPSTVAIGCPQLSETEVIDVLRKLKGKKILEKVSFWISCCQAVKDSIINSRYYEILKNSGAKLTTMCPLLTPFPRPFTTNSGKTCFYSNATYRDLDTCIKIATEGK